MDSVRIEWNAENDTYVIHIPGQPNIVATIGELEDLAIQIKNHFDAM